MEWKIELKHKELPDKVVITGLGEDPHKPIEVVTEHFGTEGKRVLEKIKHEVSLGPPGHLVGWHILSDNDMYLWRFAAAHFTREGWDLKDNLPKIKDEFPLADEEGNLILY